MRLSPTLRIGQGDKFVFDMGGREAMWEKCGPDVAAMTSRILKWLGR